MRQVYVSKVAVVVMSFVMMAIGTNAAIAATLPEDFDLQGKIKFDLMSTGVITDASGEFEAEIRFANEHFDLEIRASAQGLDEHVFYSLCVNNHLVDSDLADGDQVDLGADLHLASPPSHSSLMVTIEAGVGCEGTVVLHAMVSST